MFRARRRPLMRAAMIGGAGVMAGRHAAQSQSREQDQEQRLEQLEGQPAAPAAPAPAASAAGPDLVDRLKELSQLQQSGALSQEEFQAAKQKLLSS
ncbi:MAG TPA: SHOCT domain-containing protein [Solirubrobacteraceae bacterium]